MQNVFIPDIVLLLFPFVTLLSRLFLKKAAHTWLFACLWLTLTLVLQNLLLLGEPQYALSNWKVDTFGIFMREVFTFGALCAVLFAKDYFDSDSAGKKRLLELPEFIATIGFASFGGVIVVSACDLLTVFIGLELATIPMYALTAWNKRDAEGSEAAVKFILMGSAAAAFELFGISYLYGFSGSLFFTDIAEAAQSQASSPLLWIAVLFLISGVGFKLTLFPFYVWAPDVYDGAPTPVTALLSVTSKAVAVAFMAVLVFGPLAPVQNQIAPFLALLAALTILAGNLGALKQHKLRRFMAYSSISQAGYILIALLGNKINAENAIVFYLLLYTLANYLAFFIFGIAGRNRREDFASLRGLSKENPTLAVALLIALMSLAGIPPLAGFFGKFHLFFAAAEGHHYALITFAVLNNVLALYYYIQVLKSAWIDSPETEQKPIAVSLRQKVIVYVLMLGIILMGFFPILANNIFNGISL